MPSGKPATRLYYEKDGKRVAVDRQIESYRLYGHRCLVYEAPRPTGRFLFVAWGGLTPVAFRPSVAPNRWRLDLDGPRRFDTPIDPDGRRLLAIDWINFGSPREGGLAGTAPCAAAPAASNVGDAALPPSVPTGPCGASASLTGALRTSAGIVR